MISQPASTLLSALVLDGNGRSLCFSPPADGGFVGCHLPGQTSRPARLTTFVVACCSQFVVAWQQFLAMEQIKLDRGRQVDGKGQQVSWPQRPGASETTPPVGKSGRRDWSGHHLTVISTRSGPESPVQRELGASQPAARCGARAFHTPISWVRAKHPSPPCAAHRPG